ncbi:MAG: thioesterase family protein [Acidobacteriota bacterium]
MGRHRTTLRVRYAETDQMGVVHHAAYFAWLEVGRTEYLRARGIPYAALEEAGIRMPVLRASAEYLLPARYDDEVEIEAELSGATPVRFAFDYTLRRVADGALLCRGRTEHVATDLSGRPRRVPKDLYALIGEGLENP